MRPRNEKMRQKVREMREKGLTYWEISKVLNISPQLAHYYGRLYTDNNLTKKQQ